MDLPVEIQKMMAPKETIELFVDGELYPEITVDTLVITDQRIIIRRVPSSAAKTDFAVYRYQDITGVGLEKGFMRSMIRLRVKTVGESMDTIRLPPKLAEQAFTYIKDKVCGQARPSCATAP
jgi:Bacterial PH domain